MKLFSIRNAIERGREEEVESKAGTLDLILFIF